MTNTIGLDGDEGRKPWERSLGEFLREAVARNPDKVFLEIGGQEITYQECLRRSAQTADMFRALGVSRGDRVALFLPNCPEFLYCWFGLSLLGVISVPVNTAYKRDETAYILNNSEALALVAHRSLLPVAVPAAQLAPSLRHKLVVGTEGEEALPLAEDWKNFSESWAAGPDSPGPDRIDLPQVSPQDISMLVYTSGTTGNPKGVQVTHQMYVAAGQGFAHWTRATPEDRFFTCLPYFHANAQYYSTMGALAAGGTLVMVDRFSASRFWEQVREARATVVNFIGMMMPVLSKQPPSRHDRENLVRLFYGSPAFTPEFLKEFQERFGTEVIVGFGMTETCYGTIEQIDVPRRPNSSGLAREHPDHRFVNQVSIVDDQGNSLPAGRVGEITIKNPAMMPGYWRDEEQSRLALRDGWLYTGDLGRMDDDAGALETVPFPPRPGKPGTAVLRISGLHP